MKTTNKIICSLLMTLPLAMASCENDPEVGSTLFPQQEGALDVTAYIDNRCFSPKNYMESKVVQTAGGDKMIMQEKEVSIKVQLTNAAPQDLTFSLQVIGEETEEGEVQLLAADAIKFTTQEVTVEKGSIESSQPLVFSLNPESESLRAFKDNAIAKMQLMTKSDVKISEVYNSYQWKVTKEITNINETGTLDGKTELGVDMYVVKDPFYGSPTKDLSDGDFDSYSMGYLTYNTAKIVVDMNEVQDIIGFALTPTQVWGDWSLNASKVDVWGGMDEENMERIGIATCKSGKPSSHTPWTIEFYSPVTVKHMEIECLDNFSGGSTQTVINAEIRFYK